MTVSTPTPDARDIMNADEAADFLRVSVSWLWRSDVPRVRLGRRVVFLRAALLLYAERRLSHRITPEAA